MKAFVAGAILQQADEGIDINGNPYQQYSEKHRKALARAGEDTKVDLRLSGSLLNSIKSKSEEGSNAFSIVFAPDTGNGPKVMLGKGKVTKQGQRNISNNILAYNIQNGEGRMPKREFLGLTSENQAELLQILKDARLIE